jgi:pimeloyl-ACP methyl ester carboxylesterase
MPELARDFQVVAVDQRGIGLSDKPEDGYDAGTLANDLVALMEVLGHQRFAPVGVDTGMNIAYALAADHRDRVDRLVAGEAPCRAWVPQCPCSSPHPSTSAFKRTAKVNEQLVRGREAIYFGNEFAVAAAKPLPEYAVRYYVRILRSDRDVLRGSFGFYRVLDTTIAQNQRRMTRRLTLPVLAIGAQFSFGAGVGDAMRLVADDVQSLVIPGVGHWIAEEAPEEMLAALTAFLAPYRDG